MPTNYKSREENSINAKTKTNAHASIRSVDFTGFTGSPPPSPLHYTVQTLYEVFWLHYTCDVISNDPFVHLMLMHFSTHSLNTHIPERQSTNTRPSPRAHRFREWEKGAKRRKASQQNRDQAVDSVTTLTTTMRRWRVEVEVEVDWGTKQIYRII